MFFIFLGGNHTREILILCKVLILHKDDASRPVASLLAKWCHYHAVIYSTLARNLWSPALPLIRVHNSNTLVSISNGVNVFFPFRSSKIIRHSRIANRVRSDAEPRYHFLEPLGGYKGCWILCRQQ